MREGIPVSSARPAAPFFATRRAITIHHMDQSDRDTRNGHDLHLVDIRYTHVLGTYARRILYKCSPSLSPIAKKIEFS